MVGTAPGHLRISAEAMEDHAIGPAFIQQDLDHIVMGIAVMDDESLAQLPRQPDMPAEGLLLDASPLLLRPEVVQARLADGSHHRIGGELGDGGQGFVQGARAISLDEPRRVVGVDGHAHDHLWPRRCEGNRPAR